MKFKKLSLLAAALIALSASAAAEEPPLSMKDVIAQASWRDFSAKMTMEVGRGGGNKSTKEIEVFMRETKEGQDLFMSFLAPSNMKGTAFLAFSRFDKKDEWHMYVRTLRRVKRVPPSPENFMLRDFLSLYLLKPRAELWNCATGEKTAGADGKTLYKTTCSAVDDTTKEYTGYGKLVHLLDPATKIIMKTEFYDPSDRLIRVQEVTKVENISGINIPVQFSANDIAEGVTAAAKLFDVKINAGIKDDVFTVRRLKAM